MGFSIGKALNKITGVSDSSKQAYGYSQNLANLSYEHQKEFAQNAHQWEMKDLEKAGLNPALTTGASSAGAISGGGSTSGGGSVGNGMDLLSSAINAYNNTRTTDVNNAKTRTETMQMPQMLNNDTTNANANLISAEAQKTQAKASLINAETNRIVGISSAKFTDERTRGTSRKSRGVNILGKNIGYYYED